MLFTPRAQNRFLDLGLLLRGCRPKSRSLPGRVEVIQPVVRGCTTFWLTSTRITLTRVHRNVEERRAPGMHNTTPPATSASLAPRTLAMSCYGYDSRKPKKCRKQLNGHLSFQTTITNRLESTFPPHLCKKIKFVPDSQQPFQNGRISTWP